MNTNWFTRRNTTRDTTTGVRSTLEILGACLGVTVLAFAGNLITEAGGRNPGLPAPTRTVPRPAAPPASSAWTFDDLTPQGWIGVGASTYTAGPWVVPAPQAAAAGRGGLLVGGLDRWGSGAAVEITEKTVAPGWYTATARLRLAPGQYRAPIAILDPRSGLPASSAQVVTDGEWTTLESTVLVPGKGEILRLTVAPLETPSEQTAPQGAQQDGPFPTSFQIDEVTLTWADQPTTTASPTPSGEGPGSPTVSSVAPVAPVAHALLHYEVTSLWEGGFSGTVVLTNLVKSPISPWELIINFPQGQTITWASGALVKSDGGKHVLTGIPATRSIPAGGGSVRISFAATGNPQGTGTADLALRNISTARN
ncbi:MAG: hypothetical protein QG608_2581 [Actinomycetota bacterium]|nr:hypothetical protein [Actinomycetota bacterium]